MSGKYQEIYCFVGCICKSVGMLHHTRQRSQTYWHDASKWHNWQFWCWNEFFKWRNTWPNDLLANKMSFQWVFWGRVVPLTGNVVSRLRSIKVKAGIDPTSVIAGKNKRQQQIPTYKQTNTFCMKIANVWINRHSPFVAISWCSITVLMFHYPLFLFATWSLILGRFFGWFSFNGCPVTILKPWNRFWYAAVFVAANLTFAFDLWQTCPATCLRECTAPTLLRT